MQLPDEAIFWLAVQTQYLKRLFVCEVVTHFFAKSGYRSQYVLVKLFLRT